MSTKYQSYEPLRRSSSDRTDINFLHDSKAYCCKRPNWTIYLLFVPFVALLVTNAAWLLYTARRESPNIESSYCTYSWTGTIPLVSTHTDVSTPTGHSDKKVLKPLHWDTDYSSDNKTEANDFWRRLFPGKLILGIPKINWANLTLLPCKLVKELSIFQKSGLRPSNCRRAWKIERILQKAPTSSLSTTNCTVL